MPPILSDSPAAFEIPPYLSGASTGQIIDGLVMTATSPPIRATLVPGNQPRGAVLGVVTTTGSYALCDATASDGRQTPAGVLVSVPTAAGGFAMVRTGGTFNASYLFWHVSWTLPALSSALNAVGIQALNRAPL